MKRRGLAQLLTALVLAVTFSNLPGAYADSDVFRKLTVPEATSAARKAGKMLLLDFTASWCGPCHRMEKDTWSDPKVKTWISENAVAIQIDVDREKDVSSAMKITAMPSILAFAQKDYAKEFERQIGYMNASEFLKWLENVKSGNKKIDVLRKELAALAGKGGEAEVDCRARLAQALLEEDNLTEAADQYIWLWQHIPTAAPTREGLRLSRITAALSKIAAKSPPSKDKLAKLRDDAEQNNQLDFVVLNRVLNDEDKTLAWFDKMKTDPARLTSAPMFRSLLERLLSEKHRWSDIYLLYPDLNEELQRRLAIADQAVDRQQKKAVWKDPRFSFGSEAGVLYTSLLAAGKDAEASKLAQDIFKLTDSAAERNQVIMTALQANQPRKEQLEWSSTSALKRRVQTQLEAWLVSNNRWSEIFPLYPDLNEELKYRLDMADKALAEQEKAGVKKPVDFFGNGAATLYASLLAARRESQASRLARTAFKMRDSAEVRISLVCVAVQAKQARKEQLKWIPPEGSLRTALERMLKERRSKSNT